MDEEWVGKENEKKKKEKKREFSNTWAEAFKSPLEVPSDSGKVISAANSNPRGKYPVMKNLE